MKTIVKIIAIILFLVVIAYIIATNFYGGGDTASIVNACLDLCRTQLAAKANLSSGPCLSNNIGPGWVCDVAHNPRVPEIDNMPENQCPEYGKSASHFVEVDPNCNFIRAH